MVEKPVVTSVVYEYSTVSMISQIDQLRISLTVWTIIRPPTTYLNF